MLERNKSSQGDMQDKQSWQLFGEELKLVTEQDDSGPEWMKALLGLMSARTREKDTIGEQGNRIANIGGCLAG